MISVCNCYMPVKKGKISSIHSLRCRRMVPEIRTMPMPIPFHMNVHILHNYDLLDLYVPILRTSLCPQVHIATLPPALKAPDPDWSSIVSYRHFHILLCSPPYSPYIQMNVCSVPSYTSYILCVVYRRTSLRPSSVSYHSFSKNTTISSCPY